MCDVNVHEEVARGITVQDSKLHSQALMGNNLVLICNSDSMKGTCTLRTFRLLLAVLQLTTSYSFDAATIVMCMPCDICKSASWVSNGILDLGV